MVKFVFIITHKGIPYSSYQGQSLFLITKCGKVLEDVGTL